MNLIVDGVSAVKADAAEARFAKIGLSQGLMPGLTCNCADLFGQSQRNPQSFLKNGQTFWIGPVGQLRHDDGFDQAR